VREAAREAGVSPATFSRVERGDHLPDRENLLHLVDWAGVTVEDLQLASAPEKRVPGGKKAGSVPETVALHLRADRNLSPENAEMLANLFRTAYDTLRKRSDPK
jgi:transcriptional regulator with XRE-family HTH domain